METDKDSRTFSRQADARVVIPGESARFLQRNSPCSGLFGATPPSLEDDLTLRGKPRATKPVLDV